MTQLPRATGVVMPGTVALLARLSVVAYDGGPARIRRLDSSIYDAYVASSRQRRPRVSFEADWVAAQEGLLYVTPAIAFVTRWPWPRLTFNSARRLRANRSRVTFIAAPDPSSPPETSGEFMLELGWHATENLLAVASTGGAHVMTS